MSARIDITARRSRAGERVFLAACLLSIAIPLVLLGLLIGDVLLDGLARLTVEFLRGAPSWRPDEAGLWPALTGSLFLIGLTGLLAIPLGVGAAVYLEEYGKRSRIAGFIEINIANLAGVPSVIYGLLGLGLFVRFVGMGASVLAGACTLALLILPIIILASREALRTVPESLREGALALGATRWQAVRRVVLPLALPGMLTGSILAISRAIGETAPLIVVGAAVYISSAPSGIDSPFTALPIQIYNWVEMAQKEFYTNAAAGIVVLLLTLILLNSAAIFLRNRFQKRNLS